ncbi:hypothetical protein CEXT_474311 [Caerostris extrusa]|uniref:Uncharacterized protein n=1 Tax=Caerostris extrusa TaxID=172846 RepID=A0AAV4MKU1_CAEEX|nr:hypothetical protein CEXT_474311 [Caerostris extrusa]
MGKVLTVDREAHPPADRWGHAVGGDAQVGAHLQAAHLLDFQDGAVVDGEVWERRMKQLNDIEKIATRKYNLVIDNLES